MGLKLRAWRSDQDYRFQSIFIPDATSGYEYQTANYGDHRKYTPVQNMYLMLLWNAMRDLERADAETYCWCRGDYDRELKVDGKVRLKDVLGYLGFESHSVTRWRDALLALYGTRMPGRKGPRMRSAGPPVRLAIWRSHREQRNLNGGKRKWGPSTNQWMMRKRMKVKCAG